MDHLKESLLGQGTNDHRRKSKTNFDFHKKNRYSKTSFSKGGKNKGGMPPMDLGHPRRVVLVDSQGNASISKVVKHNLVAQLGVPYRDLRFMDPWIPISYPASIFIREKALVINFEIVRMIITKNEVYVLTIPTEIHRRNLLKDYFRDPTLDSPFVEYLCQTLSNPDNANLPIRSMQFRLAIDWDLPYELRAFEVALSEIISIYDKQVSMLEEFANPAIERLIKLVSKKELESIREVKHIMNRLIQKVAKLHREIEKLLEDDMDMLDMYLSKKEETSSMEANMEEEENNHENNTKATVMSEPCTKIKPNESYDNLFLPYQNNQNINLEIHSEYDAISTPDEDKNHKKYYSEYDMEGMQTRSDIDSIMSIKSDKGYQDLNDTVLMKQSKSGSSKHSFKKSNSSSSAFTHVDPREVAGVEALLEAYLMQIEYLWGKLLELKERIDDTEDLVELDLDHRRNELHAIEVLVTGITMAFSFVAMVAGIFGMNLENTLEESNKAFLIVTVLAFFGSLMIFVLLMGYVIYRKLMFGTYETTMTSNQKNDIQYQY